MPEVFTITLKPEQSLDAAYAFGKSLMNRRVAAGVRKVDNGVEISLWPENAGRYTYKLEHPAYKPVTYAEDREAVLSAIKSSGYADEPKEEVSEEAPAAADPE